jgi:homoaconitase/3-isopropylmalate dehydratase large subunit
VVENNTMKGTLKERLISDHIVEGAIEQGADIGLRIDQTLTQDATGTMAFLEYESIGIGRVKRELSVSYVDHNIVQTDFKNADDHRFLQSCAGRYGVVLSPPGNGVSHHVHRQRFGVPGKTLLGSDSHTTTGGSRATIANMSVDMGTTAAVFPSDEVTRHYVKMNGRKRDWRELAAERDARYDETTELDLSKIVPLVACPSNPKWFVEPSDDGERVEIIRGPNIQAFPSFTERDRKILAAGGLLNPARKA